MNHKVFKQSQMIIYGGFVKVENHSISIANMALIWVGKMPRKPLNHSVFYLFFLFTLFGIRFFDLMTMLHAMVLCLIISAGIYIAPKRSVAINIKLISGEIISFIPKNEGFTYKVYELLHDILSSHKTSSIYKIDFRGDGEIVNEAEMQNNPERTVTIHEVFEDDLDYSKKEDYKNYKTKDKEIIIHEDEIIIQELEKLYSFYNDKKDKEEELLELIRQVTLLNKDNKKENKKETYEKFVQSGLINECNEIGLNFLLDDIKNILY